MLEVSPVDLQKQATNRGKGNGASYVPWIWIGEFPNQGEEKCLHGRKVARQHMLLSQIERHLFEIAEEDPNIIDIREQYPLDPKITQEIADRLVVRHPTDNTRRRLFIMTTDFLLDSINGKEAWAVKHSLNLRDERTLQKLEIEKEYWKQLGIPWHLYTEKEAGIYGSINSKYLTEDLLINGSDPTLKHIVVTAAQELLKLPTPLDAAGQKLDVQLGLRNTSLHILKEVLRNREWDYNPYACNLRHDAVLIAHHKDGSPIIRPQAGVEIKWEDYQSSKISTIRDNMYLQRNEIRTKKLRKVKAKKPKQSKIKPRKIHTQPPKATKKQLQVTEVIRPYNGELFFGTLGRLYESLGKPPVTTFLKYIFGSVNTNPGTDIALKLNKLSERLPPKLRPNIEKLRNNHTLEPYILGFVTWANKSKYQLQAKLKSCPQCRVEDSANKGEAYWHRIHQIDKIAWCPTHECALEVSKRPSIRQGQTRVYSPEFFSPDESEPTKIINPGSKQVHLVFIQMVQAILNKRNIPWEKELKSIWGELERQGFTRGKQVDGWKVLATAKEKFGEDMENLYQIPNNAKGRRIVSNILNSADPNPHRILFLHALLDLPVWKQKAEAVRAPIDYRESRKGVAVKKRNRRKVFLAEIKGKLPSERVAAFNEMLDTDRLWVTKLEETRGKRREKSKTKLCALDAIMADKVRTIAANLRNIAGKPVWIKTSTIIKEAKTDGPAVHKCRKQVLTSKALAEATESLKDIMKRRIEWAKSQVEGSAIHGWEFKCFAGVRGLKEQAEVPEEHTIAWINERKSQEEQKAAQELDGHAAAAVAKAAFKCRQTNKRPIWVKLSNILKAAGKDAELIKQCAEQELTKAALHREIDTADTLISRRIEWAKQVIPKGKYLNRYDIKRLLGVKGWKKPPTIKTLKPLLERSCKTMPPS